jgi:D-tyrosyl-tRNA(Tyr) deacylase
MPAVAPPIIAPGPPAYGYSYLVNALIKTRFGRFSENFDKMIALIQRVSGASVRVSGETIGAIDRGLMALVAVHREDQEQDIARLAERILTYRVFPDADERMNRSLLDEGYGLLLVPQFTLAADTKKGTRASFTKAAPPDKGQDYFERLVVACRERLNTVETGRFGANMEVSLTNDGPVTFWLET